MKIDNIKSRMNFRELYKLKVSFLCERVLTGVTRKRMPEAPRVERRVNTIQ